MVPIEFDHTVLDSLPLPSEDDATRVTDILKAIVGKRVMPFFKRKRGTDPIVAARVMDRLKILRMEDPVNRVRCISLIGKTNQGWTLHIHERIFDYLAFVIPSDPESALGGGTGEERKMLAFSEFVLRHDVEHMLYPERLERDVLRSDEEFSMDRRANDPTFYRALRDALADEMNGLKGEDYLALFNGAEQGKAPDDIITRILSNYVTVLADVPESLLADILPGLDVELKSALLGDCYRRSREASYSLLKKTTYLHKLLSLFALLINSDEKEAEKIFNIFKDNWGLVFLFQELDIPEITVRQKSVDEIFRLFKESVKHLSEKTEFVFPKISPAPRVAPVQEVPAAPVKSLKDRIEEARKDTAIPRQVIDVIDKNKLNIVGHSGSKYSELIETLLAIPWGRIHRIAVTPEEFETGLNSSHYGLQKPKEILCDFFANLVWRYQRFRPREAASWRRNGSSFLFVGPPGVGKTSLAISIATNLGIPSHKLSLGGMRDEADLKGHGFTYEGSKPGAIVQGLIKMGVMNGMFIMDEADKMEKFAVATLLEILDPEQNHLFHDKYSETTVDIDLSNCHFVLTANTLETVPPAVVNRCEVVQLDRYSVDEKVAIARQFLIKRVRERHQIGEDEIFFDPGQEEDLLRFLIRTYTYEAGVRELERIIRTLFLRISRKEILGREKRAVSIDREKIKKYIEPPQPPRPINEDDRVGEMTGLGVNVELGIGSIVPIQATPIRLGEGTDRQQGYLSMVHATGNIQKIMDESRKVATTAILHCAEQLGIRTDKLDTPVHLHFMGGSTPKDGPSAGGAIALALTSALTGRPLRRDVAMTGEIDTHGRITVIGALDVKLETAWDAGCMTVIIPKENLLGEQGIERLSDALKKELQVLTYDEWRTDHEPFDLERQVLQVIAVEDIVQAAEVSFIDDTEIKACETVFNDHARSVAPELTKASNMGKQIVRLLYVKDTKELEFEEIGDRFWADWECIFLVTPDLKDSMGAYVGRFAETDRVIAFDASSEDFLSVFQKMGSTIPGGVASLVRLTLVAPFYSLKQNLDQMSSYSAGPSFEEVRLFANNYTAQQLKIKACKPVLNRVYCYLAQLDQESLARCPFLTQRDGIYMVDLSFISEKYRLDIKRAEKILIQSLTNWLSEVEKNS